jgi:hypothetical protein
VPSNHNITSKLLDQVSLAMFRTHYDPR